VTPILHFCELLDLTLPKKYQMEEQASIKPKYRWMISSLADSSRLDKFRYHPTIMSMDDYSLHHISDLRIARALRLSDNCR